MSKKNDAVAARARALVGVRFRPQGRTRESGLDCIGAVAAALDLKEVASDYSLRGGTLATLNDALKEAGLRKVGKAIAGDILVLESGPQQWHLAVMTGDGFVHAHAGLRRVVETPGPPPWPIAGRWRLRSRKWPL